LKANKTLSQSIIEEALIISDLFNLNELKAIDLLFEAEDQMQFFYGFNRGLTAVLLYFDCKKLWVNFLRTLILAMPGRTWLLDEQMPPNISNWFSSNVEKLIQNGLVQNICSSHLFYNISHVQISKFIVLIVFSKINC
jgi:hypothetical protein